MTISVVQTTTSGTFGSAVTVGNTVLFVLVDYAAPTVTVTSVKLGTTTVTGTTQLEFPQTAGGGSGNATGVCIVMLPDVQVSGQTVVNYTCSTGSVAGVYAIEVAGLGATPALDQSATATGASASIASGATGATTSAAEFVFAAAGTYAGTTTAPSGGSSWTATTGLSADHLSVGYIIQSSSGATYTWDQSISNGGTSGWAVAIVTLSSGAAALTATGTLSVTPTLTAGASRTPAARTDTGTLAVTPALAATPAPPMSSLQDNFAVNDLATLWGQSYGGVAVSGGQCQVPCTSGYPALWSTGAYNLTGSYALAQVTPSQGSDRETYLQLYLSGANLLSVYYSGGDLGAKLVQGGTTTTLGTIAYNATAHAWWRIRESSGTAYFETAPDGVTWTTRWSSAYTIAVGALSALVTSGYYGTDTTTTSYVANFNLPPAALDATASLAVTPTLTADASRGAVSRTGTATLSVTPGLTADAAGTGGGLVYMGGYTSGGGSTYAADWAIAQGLPNAKGGFQSAYQWGNGWTGTNSVESVQVSTAEAMAGYAGPCCLNVAMTQSDTETDLSSALSGSSLTTGCQTAHAATAVACLASGVQYIRMAWEFNDSGGYNWMPPLDSYTAAEFILLWQLIYGVYSSAAVTAGKPADWFQFIYCLAQADSNGAANLVDYYPGMPYASYITIDEYDRTGGGLTGWDEALNDPPGLAQSVTFALEQGAVGVGMPEWGIRNDAYGPSVIPDPSYINSGFSWMKATTEQGLNVLCWPWGAGYSGNVHDIDNGADSWNFAAWPTMWSALTSNVATGISQGWIATENPTDGGTPVAQTATGSLTVAPGLAADVSGGNPARTATASLTVTPQAAGSASGGQGTPLADPGWLASRCGLPGDATAANLAQQAGQFLAAHQITPAYPGALLTAPLSATPAPAAPTLWASLGPVDVDQPFTMPGGATAVGRVALPLSPAGGGADVVVSLCADSGGAPGAVLASTPVPASQIAQLAAPSGLASGGPLATAQSNSMVFGGGVTTPWTQPAVSVNGAGTYATPVSSGNYAILLGGYDSTASTTVATVSTIAYLGGLAVSGPVPQPSLPRGAWFGMACATADTVVFAGGVNGGSYLSNVWTASWDPSTGTVGAWTAQASLPAANVAGGMAASGSFVYVAGGSPTDSSSTGTAAVWYASAVNQQIQSWIAGPSLPQAVTSPYVAAVNGWLIVAGGVNTSGTALTSVWYSRIRANGSLGGWQAGPPLPYPAYAFGPAWNLAVTDSAIAIVTGTTTGATLSPYTQTLTVTADGPAPAWLAAPAYSEGVYQAACFPGASAGSWEVFNLHVASYDAVPLAPLPLLSVPLPATGLTAGGTYHILLHQPAGDLNDYTAVGLSPGALPSAAQSRPNAGGSWTGYTGGYAMIAGVWDQTPGGRLVHLRDDSGARATTLVKAGAGGALLGLAEATAFPSGPLNANPGFTEGTAGWSAAGGTITASGAETHGGYAFSGLLTPSGTAATASAASAPFPVAEGEQYTASGWFWTSAGYPVGLSMTWLDGDGNMLEAEGVTVTPTASTWTQITATPLVAFPGAAQAQVAVAENGSPTSGDLLYCSYVTAVPVYPGAVSAVTQVTYGPNGLPTGTVQLA